MGVVGFFESASKKTPTNKQDSLGGVVGFLAWRVVFLPVKLQQKSNCTH